MTGKPTNLPEVIDTLRLRECLGRFATGVTVVTCQVNDAPVGATVNAFTPVSLDPALVMVSLDRRSKLAGALEGRGFVVNVLGEDALDHALHFAGRPQDRVSIEWTVTGVGPRLAGAVAYFVCTSWRQYDAGDHVLFLGEVREFGFSEAQPLVFYAGAFRSLGAPVAFVPWLQSLDSPTQNGLIGTLQPAR
jgi:flavin reductase (DIM6/NTAB) family NADH-FMN oxidoreductase RutF